MAEITNNHKRLPLLEHNDSKEDLDNLYPLEEENPDASEIRVSIDTT